MAYACAQESVFVRTGSCGWCFIVLVYIGWKFDGIEYGSKEHWDEVARRKYKVRVFAHMFTTGGCGGTRIPRGVCGGRGRWGQQK